jgi:hypothetical protein
MAWTLTHDICDIYKEDKAASDALAKLRAIAESAHGDGTVTVKTDPSLAGFTIDADPASRTVAIAARDNIHLLYAAYDFETKYIPRAENCDLWNNAVTIGDHFPEWHYHTAPTHTRRGLWTWGYVIRDIRGYIDRMVSLKMNTLILWNDYPPQNSRELIDYAHTYGVKVYYGFAWGWDTRFDQIDPAHTEELTEAVVREYEEKYASLSLDGIYFQSFTEIWGDTLAGVVIADAVTKFVNRTAGRILENHPDLEILFGLHATSVMNRLPSIAKTDPRVSIIWENSGAFPYSYDPFDIGHFDETIVFHDRTRNLRETGGFGAVLKGLTKLDWRYFVHQSGDFILGEDGADEVKKNADERRKMWRHVQAYWIRNAEYVTRILRRFGRDDMITFLAEDGAIEAYLPYPLALAAEMMWDDTRDTADILAETALRSDVEFM